MKKSVAFSVAGLAVIVATAAGYTALEDHSRPAYTHVEPRYVAVEPSPPLANSTTPDRKATPKGRTNAVNQYEMNRQAKLLELKEKCVAEMRSPDIGYLKFIQAKSQWRELKPTVAETIAVLRPRLERQPRNYDERCIQVECIRSLAQHGSEVKVITPLLLKLVQDGPRPEIRNAAATALTKIAPGGPANIPALIRALEQESDVRHVAQLLGEIGLLARAAVPLLLQSLKKRSVGANYEAYAALGKITHDPKRQQLTTLIEQLKQWQKLPPQRTSATLYTLQTRKKAAAAAIPAVVALIQANPPDYVTTMAVATLISVGAGSNSQAMQIILDVLSQPRSKETYSGSTWSVAVDALKLVPGDTAAVAPLASALSSPRPHIRRLAAQLLAQIGPSAAPATPALNAALREADGHTDAELVLDYQAALAKIGPGAGTAATTILEQLAPGSGLFAGRKRFRSDSVRANLFYALSKTGVPPELRHVAIQRVLEGLQTDDGVTFVGAARVIGGLGPEAQQAVPLLTEVLETQRRYVPVGEDGEKIYHAYVATTSPRIEAAKALGHIGPAAKMAVPALQRMAATKPPNDPMFDLHDAEHARRALRRIQGTATQ